MPRFSTQCCTTCHVVKPLNEFHRNKKRPCGHHTKCIPCRRKQCSDLQHERKHKKLNTTQLLRANVMETLGGIKCAHCGFSDSRALQIDHRHGGGVRHVRSFTSVHTYYKTILADPNKKEKYQILCANCNWIKRTTNNEMHRQPIKMRRAAAILQSVV